MTRIRAALLVALCAATAAVTARTAPAQGTGEPDRLLYRGPEGKLVAVVGELKESAAGVQVIGPDKKVTKTVPAPDVVRVEYSALKNVARDAYGQANLLDGGPDAGKAAAAFADLILKAGPNPDPQTKRTLAFRRLMAAVRANDAEPDEAKFVPAATKLAAELTAFARDYGKHWECWPTATTAARLLTEIRKPADAAQVVKELGDNPNLTPVLRADARLLEVGYQLMTPGRGAAAALADVRKAEATLTPRQKDELAIYTAVLALPAPEPVPPNQTPEAAAAAAKKIRDAVAAVEAVIGKAKDPAARAAGYNALGETYLKYNLLRDAMWAYLWVDVVYNQDPAEHVKAVGRLVLIFKATGDEEREKVFRDRLTKAR